jgi:hypothetical protein
MALSESLKNAIEQGNLDDATSEDLKKVIESCDGDDVDDDLINALQLAVECNKLQIIEFLFEKTPKKYHKEMMEGVLELGSYGIFLSSVDTLSKSKSDAFEPGMIDYFFYKIPEDERKELISNALIACSSVRIADYLLNTLITNSEDRKEIIKYGSYRSFKSALELGNKEIVKFLIDSVGDGNVARLMIAEAKESSQISNESNELLKKFLEEIYQKKNESSEPNQKDQEEHKLVTELKKVAIGGESNEESKQKTGKRKRENILQDCLPSSDVNTCVTKKLKEMTMSDREKG